MTDLSERTAPLDTLDAPPARGRPPWLRLVAVVMPSQGVWLATCVWWAWRLALVQIRTGAIAADSPRLLLGLAIDFAWLWALFAGLRLLRSGPQAWQWRLASALAVTSAWLRSVAVAQALGTVGSAQPRITTALQQPGSVALLVASLASVALLRHTLRRDQRWLLELLGDGERVRLTMVRVFMATLSTAVGLTWLVWEAAPTDLAQLPELAFLHPLLQAR